MVVSMQIKIIIFAIVLSETSRLCQAETEPKKENEELTAEETKKLEIIKRIKKINEDGSYTIGYEADDGSFKIESRDVLGHIKGTYGFLDDDGQIKRVSYTTTNSTEIINNPESPSVVQRIPNKKIPTTYVFASTHTTPTPQSVTNYPTARVITGSSSTTQKPNYQNVVNVSKATLKSKYVTYTSAQPKVLLQGKPSVALNSKFNGQISKPALRIIEPTKISSLIRVTSDEKPVKEDVEPENRVNILRRELPQKEELNYDVREHIFNLQQSLGHDSVDVYSGSMTTGTPRPLFTTTARSRALSLSPVPTFSTSTSSTARTTSYPGNYIRNSLQDIENSSSDYAQETTTEPPAPTSASTSQIPTSRPQVRDPLVAIRQPNQRNAILVPLSQVQSKLVPTVEQYRDIHEDPRQYSYIPQVSRQPTVVEIDQQPALVRRLPPYPLRPMPVQVDENGYIRELPRQVPTPYPIPIPATQLPKYSNIDNVDNIQPPVSTKDFQRLLQQLILRQSRLEKINALTRQPPEMFMQPEPRYRPVYVQPAPYYFQREPSPTDHIQYIPKQQDQRHNYVEVEQQHLVPLRNQPRPSIYDEYESQSYRPNRRVARLLPSGPPHEENVEYLPSDVREMLLLRMLQLAINPALPVEEDDIEIVTKTGPVKRTPVRNVEILGEEESNEDRRNPKRTKRFLQESVYLD